MIRTTKPFRITIFALMAITLLVHIFEPQAQAGEPNIDQATISGDLASVDWKSMIGKEVTIQGELVVVDTYDLARRGQVVVARDRLYIPTSQIDPNDSEAADNSFEGGSNVAKVVQAQKQNDKATIILDDGSAKSQVNRFNGLLPHGLSVRMSARLT